MKRLAIFLTVLAAACCAGRAGAQIIVTYAGTGVGGYSGDGGAATAAKMNTPSGVAVDHFGNLYITDQNDNCVRRVDTAGIITTFAGTGSSGSLGDGGLATDAQLFFPQGVTTDPSGNVYIADQFNNLVRKVNIVTGIITTVAGTIGAIGYSGDNGPATAAHLWHPADVAADQYGNVYFVDQDNSVMRKVDAAGIITTMAGTGTAGFSGDGGPSTAAKLNFPQGIAVDTAGNVYIADLYNSRIRKINVATGIISTVAGNGAATFSGDGGPATDAALWDASAVAVDTNGNLFISDYYNSRIRKVSSTTGIITTITGNGVSDFCCDCGMATAAEIYYPQGVAADRKGNVYIADYGNHRVRIITDSFYCPVLHTRAYVRPQFELFPNPARGYVNIETGGSAKNIAVQIFNAVGIKVYEGTISPARTSIDLACLPSGVYTFYLKTDEEVVVKKLVIEQ